jgi:hypothetical protein
MPRCRTRSILDFRPVDEKVVADSGAEPSLRDLVFKYYISLFLPEEKALELARDYCNQIESAMTMYERGPRWTLENTLSLK